MGMDDDDDDDDDDDIVVVDDDNDNDDDDDDDDDDDNNNNNNNNNNEPGNFLITLHFSRQYFCIFLKTPSIYGVLPSGQRLYVGGKL
jgi:hypothetical protein